MNIALSKNNFFIFILFALFYLVLIPVMDFPFNSFLKPIPILCLLFGVWRSPVSKHAKFLLISALSFSLLGDLVLTFPIVMTLEYGIAFFMLAHCSYIILFLQDCSYQLRRLVFFLPVLLLTIFLFRFLDPSLGEMRIYVIIYLCELMAMVLFAFQVRHTAFWTAIGALVFLLSDLILAFNLFIFMQIKLNVAVMFLYYLAQLLLISSLVFTHIKPARIS